jgi:hypothetical protein
MHPTTPHRHQQQCQNSGPSGRGVNSPSQTPCHCVSVRLRSNASSTADLPTPASPATNTTRPSPSCAERRYSATDAKTSSRSRSGTHAVSPPPRLACNRPVEKRQTRHPPASNFASSVRAPNPLGPLRSSCLPCRKAAPPVSHIGRRRAAITGGRGPFPDGSLSRTARAARGHAAAPGWLRPDRAARWRPLPGARRPRPGLG